MADEHGRQQCRRLVAEAVPQPPGVRAVLGAAVSARVQVGEGAHGELLARALAALQRLDRRGAEPTQPAGVVKKLKALALALARASRIVRIVASDPEHRRDTAILHPLRDQPEDPLLKRRELGQELRDDRAVLVDQGHALGTVLVLACVRHDVQARTAVRKDLFAPALVAVQVQRSGA